MILKMILITLMFSLPFLITGVVLLSLDSVYYEGWNDIFGIIFLILGIMGILEGLNHLARYSSEDIL